MFRVYKQKTLWRLVLMTIHHGQITQKLFILITCLFILILHIVNSHRGKIILNTLIWKHSDSFATGCFGRFRFDWINYRFVLISFRLVSFLFRLTLYRNPCMSLPLHVTDFDRKWLIVTLHVLFSNYKLTVFRNTMTNKFMLSSTLV